MEICFKATRKIQHTYSYAGFICQPSSFFLETSTWFSLQVLSGMPLLLIFAGLCPYFSQVCGKISYLLRDSLTMLLKKTPLFTYSFPIILYYSLVPNFTYVLCVYTHTYLFMYLLLTIFST